MTERTRDDEQSTSGSITKPPAIEVVGAGGWTPERVAAEEARCEAVWAMLWQGTNAFAQGVAAALTTCPEDEIVLLLESSNAAGERGFLLGFSSIDRILTQLDADPAGYTEEVKRGIEEQLRYPCEKGQHKVAIRFLSGVFAVRGACVLTMSRGGEA